MIINKFLYKLKVLYYDKIDASEGIDVNKTSSSKEFNICRYWYFLDEGFKFQPDASNGCHDLLFDKNKAIIFWYDRYDWRKQNIIKHKNLLSHIKMVKEIILKT